MATNACPTFRGRQSAVYHKMLHDRDPKIGSPIRNAVSERKFLAKAMAPETQMTHLDTVKPMISQDRLPLCFCLCCRCSLSDLHCLWGSWFEGHEQVVLLRLWDQTLRTGIVGICIPAATEVGSCFHILRLNQKSRVQNRDNIVPASECLTPP